MGVAERSWSGGVLYHLTWFACHGVQVHALLDKLPPSMITLNPSAVGTVDRAAPAVRQRERAEEEAAAAAASGGAGAGVKEPGGRRGKAMRKMKRKAGNVITAQRVALQEKMAAEAAQRRRAEDDARARGQSNAAPSVGGRAIPPAASRNPQPSALNRFYVKPKG